MIVIVVIFSDDSPNASPLKALIPWSTPRMPISCAFWETIAWISPALSWLIIVGERREYVQVLRLLENFDLPDLHAAVKQAIQLGAIGFDAVKHLILCRVERRPPRLDLAIYPYLPRATVEKTSAKAYMRLLSSDAGEAA